MGVWWATGQCLASGYIYPCRVQVKQILYSLRIKRRRDQGSGSFPFPKYPLLCSTDFPRVHVTGDRRGLGIRQLVSDSGVPRRRYRFAAPFTSGQPVPSVLDPLRRESFDSGVLRPAFRRPSLAATANRRLASSGAVDHINFAPLRSVVDSKIPRRRDGVVCITGASSSDSVLCVGFAARLLYSGGLVTLLGPR